jgi:hypothetical protein
MVGVHQRCNLHSMSLQRILSAIPVVAYNTLGPLVPAASVSSIRDNFDSFLHDLVLFVREIQFDSSNILIEFANDGVYTT